MNNKINIKKSLVFLIFVFLIVFMTSCTNTNKTIKVDDDSTNSNPGKTVSINTDNNGSNSTNNENIKFNVSFNTSGGKPTIPAQIIKKNNKVTTPAEVTKEGYIFIGWYNANNKWDFENDCVVSNVQLVAKWQVDDNVKYTVNHYQQSLSGVYELIESEELFGTAFKNTNATPKNYPGFENATIKQRQIKPDGSTIVDVKYSRIKYKINLSQNISAAGSISLSSSKKYGSEVTISASTYSGYTFVGWFEGDTLLTNNLDYTFIVGTKSVNYQAKWIKVNLINSNTLGGTISKLTEKYKVGDVVMLSATPKNGYIFAGWYIDSSLLSHDCLYSYVMPDKDQNVTAKWAKFTIKNSNDSYGNITPLTNEIKSGDTIILNAVPNKGYEFLGWYDGTNMLSDDETFEYVVPSINTEVVAKWQASNELNGFNFTSTMDDLYITSLNRSMTDVIIPNIATGLSKNAFYNKTSIKNITFGKNIKLVDINAFYGCSSLNSIYYDGTIEDWCNIIFTSEYSNPMCTANNFYLKDENGSISYNGNKYRKINSVTIANGIKIGNFIFQGFKQLTSITILNGVETIGAYSFKDCCNVDYIGVPYTVTSIGGHAFENCTSLTNLVLGSEIKTIGDYAFANCSMLDEVDIPDTVIKIGAYSFFKCKKMKSCNIGHNIEQIGTYAFSASGIQVVNLPKTLKNIGSYAFSSSDVVYINFECENLETIGENAFSWCNSLLEAEICEGVKNIGKRAFYNCWYLSSVYLPATIITIGDEAFKGCSSLEDVIYRGSESEWSQITIGVDAFSGIAASDIAIFG